jgi:hypothetical protein
LRSGLFAEGEPGKGKDGDVILLTEGLCGFEGLGRAGTAGEEGGETVEAEDFAAGVPGLEQTVGIEDKKVLNL